MVCNSHKVNAKQWRKWNAKQRTLFNGVYEDIKKIGSDLFLHPTTVQRKISPKEFDTLAWNAAWTAASIAEGQTTEEVHTINDDGEVIAVNKV